MSHFIHIELAGCAYSPVNPDWPSIGVINASFDLAGGQYTSLSGQVAGVQVTNFQMTLNGYAYYSSEAPISGIIYLSQQQSGLSITFPDQTFVWNFYGPIWAPGKGGLVSESNAVNFTFPNVKATIHILRGVNDFYDFIIPEPPPITPLTCLMFLFAFWKRRRASTP